MDVITPQTESVQSTHHLYSSNANDFEFVQICVEKKKTKNSVFFSQYVAGTGICT